MNIREITHFVQVAHIDVEYESVLRRAAQMGCLGTLLEAHLTSCTPVQAANLLARLKLPDDLILRFGNFRGQASYFPRKRKYMISLPVERTGRLRVGIVLHEAAHLIDRKRSGSMVHGQKFCNALRETIESSHWREMMPTRNRVEIYQRHRGPFSLLITRQGVGKKGSDACERVRGPFSAEEAHEEARLLVGDPRDNVTDAFVFSDGEGQFIGAFYKRGEEYAPYGDELARYQAGLELPDERSEAALLPRGPEPVQPVDAPLDGGVPTATVPSRRSVRSVPPQGAAARSAPRRAGTALCLGTVEGWPKAEAAQLLLRMFSEPGFHATSVEIVTAAGATIIGHGVQHPASLVSRLKQAGHLKEYSA